LLVDASAESRVADYLADADYMTVARNDMNSIRGLDPA
jgi:hypothetical protein